MKIKCINCNGVFENDESVCPYCGYINLEGAEKEYLENLDDIVEDLDEIAQHPKGQIKKEAISSTKKTLKILIITAVAIAVLILGCVAVNSFFNNSYNNADDQMAQLLWEKEMYPKLDELYEQGDYDEIYQIITDVYSDDSNNYYFNSWDHAEFIFNYNQYMFFQEIKKRGESGIKYSDYDIASILISALEAKTPYYSESLTKEDLACCQKYAQEQYDFLISEFLYTEEELDQIYEKAMESDYLKVSVLYEEGEKREAKLYD